MTYFFENILTPLLVSIAASIVVIAFQSIKKKYNITYKVIGKEDHEAGVHDHITTSIKYKGIEVNSPFIVYHIKIHNSGKEDILFSNHFSGNILVHLPNFELIDLTARGDIGVSPTTLCHEDGCACFKWDILKKNESIQLNIVGFPNVKEEGEPFSIDKIKFIFRSDCLNEIKKKKDYNPIARKISRGITIITYILASFLMFNSESVNYKANINGETYSEATFSYSRYKDDFTMHSPAGDVTIEPSDISKVQIQEIGNRSPLNLITCLTLISNLCMMFIYWIFYGFIYKDDESK